MRENMIEEEKNQFAVLIDADNISPKYAPIIFQELEAYGFPSCRRIYGNWSKANGWNEELLLEYSIIPVQQFSYTSGKNAKQNRHFIGCFAKNAKVEQCPVHPCRNDLFCVNLLAQCARVCYNAMCYAPVAQQDRASAS